MINNTFFISSLNFNYKENLSKGDYDLNAPIRNYGDRDPNRRSKLTKRIPHYMAAYPSHNTAKMPDPE